MANTHGQRQEEQRAQRDLMVKSQTQTGASLRDKRHKEKNCGNSEKHPIKPRTCVPLDPGIVFRIHPEVDSWQLDLVSVQCV